MFFHCWREQLGSFTAGGNSCVLPLSGENSSVLQLSGENSGVLSLLEGTAGFFLAPGYILPLVLGVWD